MTRGIKDYEMVTCKTCGKEREMPKFRHSQFCSHKCANDFFKGGRFIKGQSYDERYGIEKAKEMRKLDSIRGKKTILLTPNFSMKGRTHTKETIEKMKKIERIALKNYHKNNPETEEHIRMRIQKSRKGLTFPNKPEQFLINMFKENNLPYKYVGNGELMISTFNPDFINCNGQKKIIELNGDYWHNLEEVKERDERKMKKYSELGFKTLIVWEKELKDINKLMDKLIMFNEVGD